MIGLFFLSGLAGVILAACVLQTAHQLKYWRNSGTLFQHALALNPDNFLAHCSYGCYLRDLGQLEPAEAQCRRSLEVAPNYVMGYIYLAGILEMESRSDQAISVLQAGLKVRPDFSGRALRTGEAALCPESLSRCRGGAARGTETRSR
jgi:tetratricopeptide (TPR) repeat protein